MKTFVVLLLVASASFFNFSEADTTCDNNINGILSNCKSTNPSPACCSFMRKITLECVCPRITSDVTKYISLSSILTIAKICHRTLPHQYQCGSKALQFLLLVSNSQLIVSSGYLLP
ncbi:hypothetical protein SELMODRAFT_99708 [Selaginella moellendorffii]|uniref:Bifunctional inhibitor/plant lipid transfer protein/seed storage helical domain-containing protein n=1 Tax=Selaginella moellendorffii TaxID=88036 RepID=D8RRR8_SELML|nr:hypothetical protein SELMODRAFT_135065 [Selaginella moellendorffii]EFJ25290.1 hypothetical protein SELMODRAFT_99497 [Selaginella moellendorffii]EFJ25448.1 hypothetical protein SELMODRAFT_99708 [Selaginella moellendorffii]